jgi:hypothetical protein
MQDFFESINLMSLVFQYPQADRESCLLWVAYTHCIYQARGC